LPDSRVLATVTAATDANRPSQMLLAMTIIYLLTVSPPDMGLGSLRPNCDGSDRYPCGSNQNTVTRQRRLCIVYALKRLLPLQLFS
jgi:hypothetical protein